MSVSPILNTLALAKKEKIGVASRFPVIWKGSVLSLLLCTMPAMAQTNQMLPLTQEQQQAMGLHFADLSPLSELKSYAYPANLELPMAHTQWLAAPMDGLVTQIFKVHGSVEQGEAIVELQSADLLKRQENYLATSADLKVVQQEAKRARSLVQSGVVSKKQLLATESRLATLKQQVQQLEQDLILMGMSQEAVSQLKQTHRLQPATLTIKAPEKGELFDMQVAVGMRLQMNTPIARFAELDRLVAGVFVPIEIAKTLKVGQKALIFNKHVAGEIAYISHQADPMTQTVEVHCLFPNDGGQLTAGALERIEFIHETGDNTYYEVPANAVTSLDGQPVIFLLDKRNNYWIRVQPVTRFDQANQRVAVALQGDKPKDLSQWQVLTHGSAAMLSVLAATEEGAE